MKIILPHKKLSQSVENYRDIKQDAQSLIAMIDAGNFTGMWKEALALSHAQVSTDPYAFFVVHKSLEKEFGSRIIMNAKIVFGADVVPFREACMSYPFRPEKKTRRLETITVECDIYNPLYFLKRNMKHVTLELSGLPAFIVQHEIDHAQGICVYDKFK